MPKNAISLKRLLLTSAVLGLVVSAADLSPIGRWSTTDDKTGKPRAIVQLYDQGGQIFGKIEASLNPQTAGRRCVKCADERKDQPIVGMIIIRSIRKDGDEYDGGDILDPDNGAVYRCKMRLSADGQTLTVRGYRGISLLGRSQTWARKN